VVKELAPTFKRIRKELSDHSKATAAAKRLVAATVRRAVQGGGGGGCGGQ